MEGIENWKNNWKRLVRVKEITEFKHTYKLKKYRGYSYAILYKQNCVFMEFIENEKYSIRKNKLRFVHKTQNR